MTEVIATPPQSMFEGSDASCPRVGGEEHPVLVVRQVEKVFGSRSGITRALDRISITVEEGEFVGIMGPSGSGKTTLLNCVSTIDRATSGQILVGGRDITRMGKRQLARFRREELGFIFQDANLIDTLTGYENIALVLSIRMTPPSQIDEQVKSIAYSFGVSDVLDKFPHQMSGGQRQRVAAARAIVGRPRLILADEPTGALDSRNSAIMLETLGRMNRTMGATIMMVTHDAYAASHAGRVIFVKDGAVFNEIRRGDMPREIFFSRIMEVVSFLGGEGGVSRHAD